MRRFPKVRIDRNGMAVLSGIRADDLRSIFTAASIHHYDIEKEYREGGEKEIEAKLKREENAYGIGEVCWENYLGSAAWVRRQRLLIDAVQKSPRYDHGYDNVPVTQLDHLGRFCRLRAVRDAKKSRHRLEEIMAKFARETT